MTIATAGRQATGGPLADQSFDPVTAEVIRMGLEEAVEEMATVMVRTSGSPALTEAQDFSTALFDAKGEHIAYSGYLTLHIASSLLAVQSLLKEVAIDDMKPGDAWLSNDPHVTGAMHPPDWGLVTPLFYEGSVVGFAWAEAHLLDTGGIAPGGWGVGAHDAFGECLRFPHVKLLDEGRFNTEIEKVIANNVRVPVLVLNDIRSFVAANKVCEARVSEIVGRYGVDEFERYCEILKDLSERQLRNRIGEIPNGVWTTEDWQEDNSHVNDLFRQHCTLTVLDDSLKIHFTGDPETDGLINGHYGSLLGSVWTSLCQVLAWDVPVNAGLLRCAEVTGEEGTVINCRPPAPISSAHMDSGMKVSKVVTEVISKAFAGSANPELRARVSGQFQDSWCASVWHGLDQYGNVSVFLNMDGGGGGGAAQTACDGLDVAATMCQPNNSIPDVEINEQLYPVLFLWRGLYKDSGGPGTSRGGLGLDAAWIPWDTGTYMGTLNAACSAVAPRGTQGGYSPSTCGFWVARDVDVFANYFGKAEVPTRSELMPRAEAQRIKKLGLPVRAEGKDVFFYVLGGGSGVGDPLFRELEKVAADVRDGYVTVKQANHAYGVITDEDGNLDADASQARRQEIRSERLGREPKPITGRFDGGEPVHMYLQQVGGKVSCTQCGETVSDDLDWSGSAAVRSRELSEATAEYGAAVAKHKDGELLLEERFCPGCGTSLEVTVTRREGAAEAEAAAKSAFA